MPLFLYITSITLIYVDDILLTRNNDEFLQHLIFRLSHEFIIKDLRSLHYFLGIEMKPFPSGVFLSQHKYTQDILHKTKMLESAPLATPMAVKDNSSNSEPVDATLFRSIVGALQYLTFTRPNITFVVNKVSQFLSSPTFSYLKVVKWILRYLNGTQHFGLRYIAQSPTNLYALSDADWASCTTTRKCITSFCTFLGTNCISWCAKKQPTMFHSSIEAEYRSMASTITEITGLAFLLQDIGVPLAQPP